MENIMKNLKYYEKKYYLNVYNMVNDYLYDLSDYRLKFNNDVRPYLKESEKEEIYTSYYMVSEYRKKNINTNSSPKMFEIKICFYKNQKTNLYKIKIILLSLKISNDIINNLKEFYSPEIRIKKVKKFPLIIREEFGKVYFMRKDESSIYPNINDIIYYMYDYLNDKLSIEVGNQSLTPDLNNNYILPRHYENDILTNKLLNVINPSQNMEILEINNVNKKILFLMESDTPIVYNNQMFNEITIKFTKNDEGDYYEQIELGQLIFKII